MFSGNPVLMFQTFAIGLLLLLTVQMEIHPARQQSAIETCAYPSSTDNSIKTKQCKISGISLLVAKYDKVTISTLQDKERK